MDDLRKLCLIRCVVHRFGWPFGVFFGSEVRISVSTEKIYRGEIMAIWSKVVRFWDSLWKRRPIHSICWALWSIIQLLCSASQWNSGSLETSTEILAAYIQNLLYVFLYVLCIHGNILQASAYTPPHPPTDPKFHRCICIVCRSDLFMAQQNYSNIAYLCIKSVYIHTYIDLNSIGHWSSST